MKSSYGKKKQYWCYGHIDICECNHFISMKITIHHLVNFINVVDLIDIVDFSHKHHFIHVFISLILSFSLTKSFLSMLKFIHAVGFMNLYSSLWYGSLCHQFHPYVSFAFVVNFLWKFNFINVVEILSWKYFHTYK